MCTVEIDTFVKDKRTELNRFFKYLQEQPKSTDLYYKVCEKKREFLDWLIEKDLTYVLSSPDFREVATALEWSCRAELLFYLAQFDSCIRQYIKEPECSNVPLKDKMSEFNREYASI